MSHFTARIPGMGTALSAGAVNGGFNHQASYDPRPYRLCSTSLDYTVRLQVSILSKWLVDVTQSVRLAAGT
jgi:hypothetical protein